MSGEMSNENRRKGETSACHQNKQRNFDELMGYFYDEGQDPSATAPTVREFITALQHSADGTAATIRDFGFGHGIFDSGRKGGMFFSHIAPSELVEMFNISMAGARRELAQATVDNWHTGVGFVDVMDYALTDGNYNRREHVLNLNDDQKRGILNQLEQLAIEHAQRASDLTRYVDWGNRSHIENIARIASVAADIRGMALAVAEGTVEVQLEKM